MPYIFGFVASPSKFDLYALVPSTKLDGTGASIPIISFNISGRSGNFGLMIVVLNIGRLFWHLRTLCPDNMLTEYAIYSREDGVLLKMTPECVVRDHSKTALFQSAAKLLKKVHKILVVHHVPHVETLVTTKNSTQLVAFSPRRVAARPMDLQELFEMLACVLKMLEVLYGVGWIHN